MIKPIKTERDYQKALKEKDKLWGDAACANASLSPAKALLA
jgi:hypothetical protein